MKVLLVTSRNKLSEKLSVLNPELEYCAIVTDDVESAKEVLDKFRLSQNLLYPMSELKPCVENFTYDYALCVQPNFYDRKIMDKFRQYNVPKDKFLNVACLSSSKNFKTERVLRYWKEYSQDFEIFATGISHTWAGLDATQFKRKLYNFAKPGQDLYYDFQIAKIAISCGGGIAKFVMR